MGVRSVSPGSEGVDGRASDREGAGKSSAALDRAAKVLASAESVCPLPSRSRARRGRRVGPVPGVRE